MGEFTRCGITVALQVRDKGSPACVGGVEGIAAIIGGGRSAGNECYRAVHENGIILEIFVCKNLFD